ncbi:MAG: phosphotransferase [Candidatus Sulfotelmatobacter sp.]
MDSQEQSERETCRVIVLGRDGTEVLLKTGEPGFAFPAVEIPRWERLAENLTAAVKEDWGCDAICLFTLECSPKDRTSNVEYYEVMECWRDRGIAAGTVWMPISSLSPNSLLNPEEVRAFEECLHRLNGYECDQSSPFARRGWLSELRDWTAQIIRPLGLELTGPLRQYNASPAFNLIRFETTGLAVWFKAVGEPNLREFPITMNLAELFPMFIPEVLATKPEWNGWLSREVDGKNLGETRDLALWEQTGAGLARLQIQSIPESESILRLGAHDLRFNALLSAIEPFFDVVGRLMDEQPKTPPAILSRAELSLLRVLVDDALTLLADLRIPNTLGHLDLNPGNILVSAHGCIFLDWAEAYVGFPLFSFEYLLEHFRRQNEIGADHRSRMFDAYTTPCRQAWSNDRMTDALTLAPLAAVFAYAVGTNAWKEEAKLRDPKFAGYVRSLARRMNREAIQLERRSSCLS